MIQIREHLFRLRLLLIVLGLAAFIGALALGAMVTVTREEALNITESVQSAVPRDDNIISWTSAIFLNNFRIALFGFIPFLVGAGLLLLIGFSTGIAFAANALLSSRPITGLELLFFVMLFPFFFWELSAYALTMMEGIIITRGLIKRGRIERFIAPGHFRDGELFKALLILGLTAFVLFIAALMESYLILSSSR